jgi:hypothetical protein
MCSSCGQLQKIDEIVFGENLTKIDSFCWDCKALTDVTASGTIPVTISFTSSPLTAESAISVINCLKDYSGTDKDLTQTITFSATTKTALDALGAVAPNGLTWLDYIGVKGWLYA